MMIPVSLTAALRTFAVGRLSRLPVRIAFTCNSIDAMRKTPLSLRLTAAPCTPRKGHTRREAISERHREQLGCRAIRVGSRIREARRLRSVRETRNRGPQGARVTG